MFLSPTVNLVFSKATRHLGSYIDMANLALSNIRWKIWNFFTKIKIEISFFIFFV